MEQNVFVVEAGVMAFVFVELVVIQPFSSCVGIFSGILGTCNNRRRIQIKLNESYAQGKLVIMCVWKVDLGEWR